MKKTEYEALHFVVDPSQIGTIQASWPCSFSITKIIQISLLHFTYFLAYNSCHLIPTFHQTQAYK